jgi:hypothetical protein
MARENGTDNGCEAQGARYEKKDEMYPASSLAAARGARALLDDWTAIIRAF